MCGMRRTPKVFVLLALIAAPFVVSGVSAQKYTGGDGRVRVALAKQPFSPNGTSPGPNTMANGGVQDQLAKMGVTVRVAEAKLTADENTEYGGWKRLGMALGHFSEIVAANERDGYFSAPDINTPATTRSGALGGMPGDVATGRALQVMRLDAKLDPPLSNRHIVMGGVRLTDPLEQRILDDSQIEQLSVDDLRTSVQARERKK